jgi:hypothetical protein
LIAVRHSKPAERHRRVIEIGAANRNLPGLAGIVAHLDARQEFQEFADIAFGSCAKLVR